MEKKRRENRNFIGKQTGSNNHGFSLVEILVTIMILGLLVSVTIFHITTTQFANVEKCSQKIEKRLNQLRLSVMSSKEQNYLIVYQAADLNYYVALSEQEDAICVAEDGDQIGNSSLRIRGKDGATIVEVSYEQAKQIVLSFQKSSGAFLSVAGKFYDSIDIVNGDAIYRIYLVKETGKHYAKQVNS
ncbi:prepilin-type N-terminal cleavage/methylation domain-containing protein [Anaerosporobacter faecicola]|uniref:prepilin-type N-terminal cleavage/methylation domain-containing protein n=1 Tax=Anaerosporobacter faecicola TaxID=2718714 RepID=UPI00143886BE|nr:prepilin-type N-terminal cleavage/methylation domain-containing protein [Anaerosporobacter faecicola]